MVSLRRQMVVSLALQGSGAAATLVAVLWIGKALGPDQQGQFSLLKAQVEFGAALAMLGMPQALYVLAQQGRLSWALARRTAARLAWIGLPVGVVLAFTVPGVVVTPAVALAMGAAVALASLQGQWRALALLADSPRRFNLATLVPAWVLLALAGLLVATGGQAPVVVLSGMALAWCLGSLVADLAWRGAGRPGADQPPAQPAPWALLLSIGLAAWLTASLATAALVLQQLAAEHMAGAVGLGRFSMALLLVQIPMTPLNLVLPLLLRQRLRQPGAPSAAWRVRVWWAALPMLGLALAAHALGQWRTDLWLGEGYRGLHALLPWLLAAGGADMLTRLRAVDVQAEGRPWQVAAAEGLRLAVLAVAAVLVLAGAQEPSLTQLAQAVFLAACVACLAIHWRRTSL